MSSLAYLDKCKAERMPYWDRAKVAKDIGLVFKVFVPVYGAPSVARIAKGSGVVGVADDGFAAENRRLVHFEGDIYSAQPRMFGDLVYHAADRMATAYPTIARAVVPLADLVDVGYFDYSTRRLIITNQVALNAWRT